MSVYNTPARVRFPRSNVTGTRPPELAPGSLGINWPDKVIWVGDAGGSAIRFSRKIDPWRSTLAYYENDIAIFDDDLWVAVEAINPGPFDTAQWRRLTDAARSGVSEPYATSSIEGGVVTQAGTALVNVAAGSGYVVDTLNPAAVDAGFVAWSLVPLVPVAYPGETWSVFIVSPTGVFGTLPLSAYTPAAQRSNVRLAYIRWDQSTGEIVSVTDGRFFGAGVSEMLRDQYRADGGAYRADCALVRPTGGLELMRCPGTVFALQYNRATNPLNPNLVPVPGADPVTFTRLLRTGAAVGAPVTAVDPDRYDAAGVIGNVPVGRATIQYVFMLPDGSQSWVQYGQTVYTDLNEAVSSLQADWQDFDAALKVDYVVLTCAIAVAQGATDLTDRQQAAVVNAPRGPFPFDTASNVNDARYVYLDGSRPMLGDLDFGGNAILNADIDGGTFT